MKTPYSDIDRFTRYISMDLGLYWNYTPHSRSITIYCLDAPSELIKLPLCEIEGERYSEAVEKVEVALAMRRLLQ